MIKKIFLGFSLFIWVTTFAQSASAAQTISLLGEAHKKVSPDVAVISFLITGKDKEENIALTNLNMQTQQVVDKLTTAGFTKDQLKIADYNLNENYNYSNGNSKKVGYVASQTIILKFKLEKEKLSKLFGKFSAEKTENVTVNFGTEISDEIQEKTTNELIILAIQDATKKANIIAGASKLKIKTTKDIEYKVASNSYNTYAAGETRVRFSSAMTKNDTAESSFLNINVNEVELSETIKIIFWVEAL
jgi:hypothetical protein